MTFIMVHKPLGVLPPEMMATGLEMGKKIAANPEAVVPGGKCICSYYACSQWLIFCVWESPKLEILLPLTEQMKMVGWNTEIIPVDETGVALQKIEAAMASMQK